MLPTLFTIPRQIGGISVFGFGWLLAIWAVFSAAVLVRQVRRSGLGAETLSFLPSILLTGAVIALVLPALQTEHGLPIRGYGVMLVLGIAAGVGLSMHRARQFGRDPQIVLSLAFWMVVAGFIGGRAFYVIEYWQAKYADLSPADKIRQVLDFTSGGLVMYGAYLAGALGLVLFVRRHKLPALALCDLVAPGAMLGLALGRIGCLCTGCCYGGLCELPWAVTFPGPRVGAALGSPPYADQLRGGLLHGITFRFEHGTQHDPPVVAEVQPGSAAAQAGLKPGDRIDTMLASEPGQGDAEPGSERRVRVKSVQEVGEVLVGRLLADKPVVLATADDPRDRTLQFVPPARSRPVHPTQLYSAIDALLTCLFLLAYAPWCRRDGQLLAMLLSIHPLTRFLIEVIRVDEAGVWGTGLSISQNISLGLLAGAAVLWVYVLRQPPGLALLKRTTATGKRLSEV